MLRNTTKDSPTLWNIGLLPTSYTYMQSSEMITNNATESLSPQRNRLLMDECY